MSLVVVAILLYILRYNWIAVRLRRRRRRMLQPLEDEDDQLAYWQSQGIRFITDPVDGIHPLQCSCDDCRVDNPFTSEKLKEYIGELATRRGDQSALEQTLFDASNSDGLATHLLAHGNVTIQSQSYAIHFIVSLYNNRYIRALSILAIAYLVGLFTLHLWLPMVAGNGKGGPTLPSQVFDNCYIIAHRDNRTLTESYCSTQSRHLWHTVDYRLTYQQLPGTRGVVGDVAPPLFHFIDAQQQHQYQLCQTVWGTRLVNRHRIDAELERLRVLEAHGDCICPVFLGFLQNMTFLYDRVQERWVWMMRPHVYRNNTLSKFTETTVLYEKNQLYYNYNAFVSFIMHNEMLLEHYETIHVDYIEEEAVSRILDDYSLLKSHHRALAHNDVFEKSIHIDDPLERTIPFKIQRLQWRHKQVVLSGDASICYHFCEHTNRRVLF